MNRWKYVGVDNTSLLTSRPGVFAGGDCATGPSTLIHAMAAGLKAARAIDDWVRLRRSAFLPALAHAPDPAARTSCSPPTSSEIPVKSEYRVHHPELDPEIRKQMFEEVEHTISAEEAYREAKRCLQMLSRLFRHHRTADYQSPTAEGAAHHGTR